MEIVVSLKKLVFEDIKIMSQVQSKTRQVWDLFQRLRKKSDFGTLKPKQVKIQP